MTFSARVSSQSLPVGMVVDGVSASEKLFRISIEYTAPETLAGLTVTCVYGGKKTAETAILSYPSPTGSLTVSLPFGAVEGLLTPATVLLPWGDAEGISPVRDGVWTVTCRNADGKSITYRFSESQVYPIKIEGFRLSMYADPAA